MIGNITIGQYYPGSSIIHRVDPRVKIILTLIFMILVFVVSSPAGYALVTLFTMIAVFYSEVPIRYALKGLKPLLFIIIFVALINILTVKGETILFEYSFIHISLEGILTAGKMCLRLILLVITASLMTLTTTPIMLTDGIEKLLGPLKYIRVPTHEIAMMMTIALRFIPTLMDETDKIMKAQAARGADFDTGNIVQKAKSFVPVLVPLFISAFRRADELATAMEARCYRGGEGRTRMKQLKLTKTDAVVSGFILIFIAAVTTAEIIF
ncbi:MAG: energy-coupling factor transporter transmembrane component T [Eubacteriales bacterium]|nr:energy-coupling factor transporter transmembrane component T [Eubacteriales bacterium]